MENFIKEHDYAILVYAKEDTAKYTAAIKALTETKKMSGWDRVQGVTIHKDCRIPSLYHGEDLAIVMERDNGSGQYSIRTAAENRHILHESAENRNRVRV